jgi:hypothetical protein|tara:strand:- start:383 stop:601 length:219 start_codon:yes stop_codon:yes gene_type:complete
MIKIAIIKKLLQIDSKLFNSDRLLNKVERDMMALDELRTLLKSNSITKSTRKSIDYSKMSIDEIAQHEGYMI